jgi:hypothetical protein
MKKTVIALSIVLSSVAQAQTVIPSNIVRATNGNLLLQGTNSSGTATQSVSISNVGHVDARSASFNGADGVAAQKFSVQGGSISGAGTTVVIDAVGNGNVVIKDSTQVQGNISASGTISSSQQVTTTGTGSIHSAYNLSAAGNKFNVAGDTGAVTSNGINNTGKKIVNVAEGAVTTSSKEVVTGSQLYSEQEARVTGDADAVAQANGYTDSEIEAAKQHTNTIGNNSVSQANAYTDQQVKQVSKEVKEVGAMAMAASVVGSVSPQDGSKTVVTAAVGAYSGETAVAVGVTHQVLPKARLFGAVSRTSSRTGVAIGASFSF